ncbi:CRISPR-associated endonuclease Cas1 [Aureispira sp. CCB-E]|uniref:CRISPR-associated endonuclease Cas1 n=1 Tax=Aureispira sp. CCB-E TaxID=3051121 RepID=UPI00286865FF|nr:CRISPR-associated endonuclease Cas1 [Aureispira sp. CCB-E]WMX17548.1 CRISPR-associated endonuclease Cas1 [Aureispira sp. CCB-E]
MQLYIDSYGAFLGVKDGMFWVKPIETKGKLIAVRKVRSILLSPSIRVSTDALFLALKNSITVLLLDKIGRSKGLVWSGQYGSISTIRKHQALFAQHIQGMLWIRDLLLQKINNQQSLLKQLYNDNYLIEREYLNAQKIMANMIQKFQNWSTETTSNLKEIAASFRGWEGTASRAYFYCLSLVIPKQYNFKKRSKHPAYDPFNACMNYLYGILYGIIEIALIKAGIDPYMGVLHTDRYNTPTLVFDVIDQYRSWVDELIIQLFLTHPIPSSYFQKTAKEGLWLSFEGKETLVHAFTKHMNQIISYKGNKRKRRSHIDINAFQMATMFKFFSPSSFNS